MYSGGGLGGVEFHLIGLAMQAYKISIKLFATKDEFAPSEFVPVFHHWIQTQALADHLMIDVADYAHVHNGPGTVLVTQQANLYTDRGDGRLGLLYSRKLPVDGADTFVERLRHVLTSALKCAALLEREPSLSGRVTFRTNEFLIRINDRLLAPNTAETFAAMKGDLEQVAKEVYGQPARLEHKPSPLTLFEVRVSTSQSPTIAAMLEHSGASTPAIAST